MAQHLTNTVFVDRALIVQPHQENEIPDAAAALQFTSAAGLNSGSNSGVVSQVITAVGGAQVISTIDPRLQALGLPQYPPLPANMDPSKVEEIRRTIYVGNLDSKITAEEALKFFNQIGEVKYVRMAGDETQPTRFAFIEFTEQSSVANALQYNGVTLGGRPLKINHSNNAIVKPHTSKNPEAAQKEIEETMKRVREAQHMITAQIDPSMKLDKVAEEIEQKISRNSKSRSKSRERKRDRTRSRSRERRDRGDRRRSRSRSRERRRSRSKDRRTYRVRESPKRRSPPRRRSRDRRSRSRDRPVRRSPVRTERSYRSRYSPVRTKDRRDVVDRRRKSRTRSRSRDRRDDRKESRRAKTSPRRHRDRSPAEPEGPALPPSSESPPSSPRVEGPVTPPEDVPESSSRSDRLAEIETPPAETVYKKRTSRSPARRRSRSRDRKEEESRKRSSRRERSRSKDRDRDRRKRHRSPIGSAVTRDYDEEEKGFGSSPQNGSRNNKSSPQSSD